MAADDQDFWNGRFAGETYIFGTRPAAFLANNAHYIPPRSHVLVPADGEGRNSVFLAELGHRVVATDIAEAGIAKARKLADTRGVTVELRHLDLQGWKWPQAELDAVVAIFIQFAPPTFRDEIFAGMKRAVRPGGFVLLHGYTPKQLEYRTGGPAVVEQLYTEELLRAAFADWEILRIEAYEPELDEGEGHKGRSAVIDLIARRPALAAAADQGPQHLYHGTKADLKPGDLIEPGHSPNFGKLDRKTTFVYLTATLDAATWGAELSLGDGPGRIYIVEPTGPLTDDPNLTDKKFPGNPTKSYRSRQPLRVIAEHTNWQGHAPDVLQAMRDNLARLKQLGVEPIDD
jgi:SAM-dependent methyltransferase